MKKADTLIKFGLNFDNSYTRLPNSFFKEVKPTLVHNPNSVVINSKLASSLGLNSEVLETKEFVEVLGGNIIPEGAHPIAQAYAGHQFGHFTMLGDGRAILLGEHITPLGDRVDIQLKGSGKTPYSRGGDGRAALGPMLREYIISEAMQALGIPTTRSLAVVTTGESIIRENKLPGAILTRIAASHIRVGTFQYVSKWGRKEDIKILADYTISRHYKYLKDSTNPYLDLLKEVINRQADLISKWQLVGFIHGVMNTDNMAISGETIDYGPCAFMDTYNLETVFSSIDTYGRYAYGNQPYIGGWNLARFAETLLPLLDNDQEKSFNLAQEEISNYSKLYHKNWLNGMRAKLGMFNEESLDEDLINQLLNMMQEHSVDYTNTFVDLTFNRLEESSLFKSDNFLKWHKLWKERLQRQNEGLDLSIELMKNTNPAIIPRNHRVEEALEAANNGDYSVMDKLIDVLSNPFAHSKEQLEYSTPPKPSNKPYRTFCGT